MKITNKSGKLIGIGELTLLPGETETLPKDYEKNPVIQFFADTGRVELADDDAGKPAVQTPPPPPPLSPEDELKKVISGIKEMKREELDSLAKELGVEIEEKDTVPTLREKLIAFYQK